MSKLDSLDRLGMTGPRLFFYAIAMPFAGAALIYGLFNIGASLAIGAATKAHEWIALALGVLGVPLALRIKRGAGAFRRVLATRPQDVATLKLLTLTATGAGLGKQVGYAWLVDGAGKNLATLVVDDVNRLPAIREIVTGLVPKVSVVEETETAHAQAA